MTPTECVNLVRLINARCPSMRLDDATPDAWYIDLRDVDATDAREAAITLSRRQAYIALHELLTEAATIERRRVGQQRVAELQARIEAENGGELSPRPVAALTVGQPIRQVLARAVSDHKRREIEQDTRKSTEHQERMAEVRAHLDSLRTTPSDDTGAASD